MPIIAPFTFGDDELNLDDTVTATCTITKGDLPLKLFWRFTEEGFDNSYNLTTNDGIAITRNGQKVSTLLIDAVKARHRGNYTCMASNKAGTSQHSAYLKISGENIFVYLSFSKPEEFCSLFYIRFQCFRNCFFQVLPAIVPFNFGEEEVNLDESISATCSITKGDLPMQIWWRFTEGFGDMLSHNLTGVDGVDITRNSQRLSVLNIDAVKSRHRGNYTCFAENKAGFAQHSAYLSMNGCFSVNNFLRVLSLNDLQFVSHKTHFIFSLSIFKLCL